MGSYSILVIGDDWREQIKRHGNFSYHNLAFTNIISEAQSIFKTLKKNKLLERAKELYGIVPLGANQEPEKWGRHSLGWIRLDSRKTVVEIMVRVNEDGTIYDPSTMGSSYSLCYGTNSNLLLKKGTLGYNIEWDGNPVATEYWAGAARKRDIDIHAMREANRKLASEIWTRARTICGSELWVTLESFCEKYQNDPHVWDRYRLAEAEWSAQQPISQLLRAGRFEPLCYLGEVGQERFFTICSWHYWPRSAIDRFMLPHDQFVARYGIGTITGHSDVLRNGVFLKNFSEDVLLDSVRDDELITLVSVKQ